MRPLLLLLCLLITMPAAADITATATIINDDVASGCTVNWLEPLSYTEPVCIPVTVPSSVSNSYWVDLSGGTGSTCSQASPCDSFADLSGKTTSGGARVHVKGNGRLDITTGTFAGTAGSPIHIQPWPSDPTPTVLTAAAGCGTNNANRLTADGWQHIVFDGGSDMLIRFVGSGCTTNQNGYTLINNSDDITLWRVRIDVMDSAGPGLGIATNEGANTANFRFINSELYNANRYYGVYTGGGADCLNGSTTHSNLEFRNSIFRDIDGRGIQIEPRDNSSGVLIDGNAFHNIGYDNSGSNNGISSAVQPAAACGGSTTNITVSNNFCWDLAGGCVHSNGSHTGLRMIGNTIWDYGNAGLLVPASRGLSCSSDGCPGEARNNIILQPTAGVDPFFRHGSWATNDNLCESGAVCGSGALTGTAATALDSTSTASASFLKPNGNALGNCLVISGATEDYLRVSRGTVGGATDCGAVDEP